MAEYFAQIDYPEYIGDSHVAISVAGCLETTGSNLLKKCDITEDPEALNRFYTAHNVYIYDVADHANDDLNWNSVTRFCPQLVATATGVAGFPVNDLAAVEFRYKASNGQEITHFCAVNSHADKSIIDSWDGKVKTPAQYESYYGMPVAWATYEYYTTSHPSATATPAAVVSAPKAAGTSPKPSGPSIPAQLYLPPSISAWHVYKPGGPYTLPYATHVLDPHQFGGLTYDILGSPVPNVYLIQTQDFGEVAIYAGPDTLAEFPGVGHGEGEDASAPAGSQVGGVPVNEVVPAPGPRPPALTSFDNPMHLLTKNDPTDTYDPATGEVVGSVPKDSKFTAIGKYETEHGVFFNDGQLSVKTVALSPDPNPAGSDEQKIEVRVVPPAPDAWQRTFQRFMNPVEYRLTVDSTFHDLSGEQSDVSYAAGTKVMAGGTFEKDGVKYCRGQSSIEKGTWYGLPIESLQRVGDPDDDLLPEDLFDPDEARSSETAAGYHKGHHKTAAVAGTAVGLIKRLRGRRS